MTTEHNTQKLHWFTNEKGEITVWEWPNIPLYGWAFFMLLSLFLKGSTWHSGIDSLSKAFLFIWAYLELTQGVNYFRRLLGLVVLAALVYGFFKP